jgi:thioredoxin 2
MSTAQEATQQAPHVTLPCPSCGRWNRIAAKRITDGPKCGVCAAPLRLDHPVLLTDATFDRVVSETTLPVLVDFYADWCGPCKMLAPVLEQLAAEHTDVKIAKVNVDEEPALAERYRVRGIPYVALFKEGKLASQVVGYRPKAALESGLGLNGTKA